MEDGYPWISLGSSLDDVCKDEAEGGTWEVQPGRAMYGALPTSSSSKKLPRTGRGRIPCSGTSKWQAVGEVLRCIPSFFCFLPFWAPSKQ